MSNVGRQTDGRERAVTASTGPSPGPLLQDSRENEYFLSVGALLQVMWRWMWVILLTALLTAGAIVGYDLIAKEPQYEASIQLLIGQKETATKSSGLSGVTQGLQDAASTMTVLVQGRSVAEAVIRRLGLSATPGEIEANLHAEQLPETSVIEVSYTDPNPQTAQRMANTVGEEFSNRISRISPKFNALTATVWERAVVPQEPIGPKLLRDGLLALVLGAMLGIGLAFLLEQLDDSWRSSEEVEQISGVPTFGVIPEFEIPKNKARAGA